MFISLDWISDFVDLSGHDPAVIADRLTMATAEVEGFETIHRFVNGPLVGKIIEAEKITSGEKTLTHCVVDCGNRTYPTVCGAPNAALGKTVVFAPAGTTLGDKKIESTTMAGHPSEGILCSAAELGLSSWHEILFELPADIPAGIPLSDLIPETDTLIEIDNKSLTHRPDLWGHYGFARELSAIFGRPLKELPLYDVDQFGSLPLYPVKIEDANCLCYSALRFGVTAGSVNIPSPVVMQRRLHALGQRTYNLLVDLTNYVSLELGQPTHAFDADTVSGICVAPMGKEGTFVTLDSVERKMIPEDMMICDDRPDGTRVPVAIAGIMGGLATEVTDTTTRIVLESANFTALRIRRTAQRLDLRTDASQRYKKSQPPANVKVATRRILRLLADSGTVFHVESRFSMAGDLADSIRTITLPPGRLNALAGIDYSNDTVTSILRSIGFQADFDADGVLTVGVPPFRSAKDISIPEDIVEEVMRLYGFDNVPPVMPAMPMRPLFVEKSIRMEHKARRLLAAAYGFCEVHNYGWFNDTFLKKIGYEPGPTLTLANPAAQPESRLRITLIPNLLALVPKNRPLMDAFRCFELGRVYLPKGDIDDKTPCRDSADKCLELPRLAGVSYLASGRTPEEHYLEIKAAIEDLGALYARDTAPIEFAAGRGEPTPWQREGEWVEIRQEGKVIGVLGVAGKALLSALIPEGGMIIWFELALDQFRGDLYPEVHLRDLPRFPGSWQDFSLVWPLADGYEKLAAKLDQFKDELLLSREFLTSYEGKGMEPGMASYSFRFLIGAKDHTLSGEEIEGFHTKMLGFLKDAGIAIR